MKVAIDRERFKLYLWLGAAYLLLWLLRDLFQNPERFFYSLVNTTWLIAYLIGVNYILFEFTLPFINLSWKRLLLTPFLLFGLSMLYSFGFYGWRNLGILIKIYTQFVTHASVMKGVAAHVPYSFFSILFFGVIRYTYDFRKLKAAAQQLQIEKQAAELNFLKSQTNPHFLFNTLNNIYSLARDKYDLAPESILRLSKILRFMLYETGSAYIAIEQELKIIADYIALEKLRYDESLQINFSYTIDDLKQALPPLLLMPLVENAFKHGVSETRDQPFVMIQVAVKKQQLTFMVKNSTDDFTGKENIKENIGLSNLRRQLELLYSDYKLLLQPGEFEFTATLTINLASHV